MLTMEIKGLEQLKREIKDLPAKLAKKALRAGVAAGAVVLRKECRARFSAVARGHGKPYWTGRSKKKLRKPTLKSIRFFRVRRVGNTVLRPGPSSEVYAIGAPATAMWMEFGVKPHVIGIKTGQKRKETVTTSSGAKVLRWKNIYARKVQHPGYPARPFMRPAFDSAYPAAIEAAKKKMQQEVEILYWKRRKGW